MLRDLEDWLLPKVSWYSKRVYREMKYGMNIFCSRMSECLGSRELMMEGLEDWSNLTKFGRRLRNSSEISINLIRYFLFFYFLDEILIIGILFSF